MQPSLTLTVKPLPDTYWAQVTLVASVSGQSDTEADVVLYDQLRAIQPMDEHVGFELWACGSFGDTANAITAALMELVRTGSLTLMADLREHNKLLS